MSEQHYLSVSAISAYLSKKFDVDPYLKRVFIKGEVSNYNNRRVGIQYFNLKDEEASISVMCYKKLTFELEEGMQVLAIGTIKLSSQYGNYKLHIEQLEPVGAGVLYEKFKQLRESLKKEGLFDLPKKSIPKFPKRIAILTSESGAVIHDIQTTILNRFPIVQLDVYPTVVQGNGSVASIVNNLKRVENSDYTYDTVIIARGGGSIEDLWSFNEEAVVRAIVACPIPIISSIGHETDVTLSDFVADMRAATPTAAAQQATSDLAEIVKDVKQLDSRLETIMATKLTHLRTKYEKYATSYVLVQPARLYDGYLMKFKQLNDQLQLYMQQQLTRLHQKQDKVLLALQLNQPMDKIHLLQQKYDQLTEQLRTRQQQLLTIKEKQFELTVQKLDLLSPLKNMARGYSIALKDDTVITRVNQVNKDDLLHLEVSDGTIHARVESIEEKKRHGN